MTYDLATDFDVGAAVPAASPFWLGARPASFENFAVTDERPQDRSAREALLDAVMPDRRSKTCERLREGRTPAAGLALVARPGLVARRDGIVIGTVRLWPVQAEGLPMLLLGPLAVAPDHRSLGIGAALMRTALARAETLGHKAVLLVGDAPYYGRFGFQRRLTERLALPGPVAPDRFLGLELEPGALADAQGMIRARAESAPAGAGQPLAAAA